MFGNLVVKPVGAKILKEDLTFRKYEVYCVFKLGNQRKQTQINKLGGKSPSWLGEQLNFKITNEDSLVVELYDLASNNELVGMGSIQANAVKARPQSFHNIQINHKGKISGEVSFQCDQFPGNKEEDPDNPELEKCEQCAMCGQQPEDILLLACHHDLCLNCASKVFNKEQNKAGKLANLLICEICNCSTPLDNTTVYELEKIFMVSGKTDLIPPPRPIPESIITKEVTTTSYSKKIEKPQYQFTTSEIQETKTKGTPVQAKKAQPSYSKEKELHASGQGQQGQKDVREESPESKYKETGTKCQKHPDEYVTYFCFDCKSACICPECIIHGVHKNHEVQTIKKAQPIIRKTVEENKSVITKKLDTIKLAIEENHEKKNIFSAENSKLKDEIMNFFQTIREELLVKEKEICQEFDKNCEENNKMIDGRISELDNKTGELLTVLDEVGKGLKSKNETFLVNQQAANIKLFENWKSQEAEELLEEKEPTLLDMQPIITRMEEIKELISKPMIFHEKKPDGEDLHKEDSSEAKAPDKKNYQQ